MSLTHNVHGGVIGIYELWAHRNGYLGKHRLEGGSDTCSLATNLVVGLSTDMILQVHRDFCY
jgi:hypothetical protein